MYSKKDLTERDICTKFITPALERSGWDIQLQVLEEFAFTHGRIYVKGKLTARGEQKRADYILFYKPGIAVAIIEAKDNHHAIGSGMQQGLRYAEMLDIPCVFSSNGDGFLFHDRTVKDGQIEKEISLEEFPTPDQLSKEGAIFVRMGNLSKETYRLRMDKIQFVSPPRNSEGNRTRLESGDILISITGEVGNLGLIPRDFGEAYINQHTSLVRLNELVIPTLYCNFFLSEFLRYQFQKPQRGLKNSFRLSDVSLLTVPIPPRAEQHRIVTKLEQLKNHCDELEHSIKQSQIQNEQLLQQVLREALQPNKEYEMNNNVSLAAEQ